MIVVPFKLMDIIISLNVKNLSVTQLQISISESLLSNKSWLMGL